MRATLISFSTPEFRLGQILLNLTGRIYGAGKTISFKRSDLLKTEFYKQHKHILDQPRGAGYWLWKPYYILETLNKLEENEILIYADAGLFFRKNIRPLTDLTQAENGIALFYNYGKLGDYTKRDMFVAAGCDTPEYHQAPLIHANIQVYRKCPASLAFLRDVLTFCTTDELITDAPNRLGLPNLEGFIDHRHDQSAFSILAHKSRIRIYLDPSQMKVVDSDYEFGKGNIPHEPPVYSGIIYMHRYKNKQIINLAGDIFKKIFRSQPKSA